ncbi:GNAT family N-acetyltransferase [Microbacterium oryzae]|uniref:GNAT family N-acetyltransferase n=1 Tax=Microbacterium oryzae TaxID=743009 RepID=A0A6I6DWZ4_9MICO|nr:GNAT family N-acetyltransferase [Microbacterium oryzae]QGU26484.1 GNAT family N-acetyltransferase [Microbacterium oryzae]
MAELVVPDVRFHTSFLESHREWAGAGQDGAGLHEDDDIVTPGGFERWVAELVASEHTPRRPGLVPDTYRWIVEGDEYLGAVSFRHELTEWLHDFGGHIGYGVRPSARGRGLASWALGCTLDLARERGYPRVLLVCRDDNAASARVIEKNGGILEDKRRDGDTLLRRYWVNLR